MEIPEYVTVEEVQRVCRELGLRDWTELTAPEVEPREAVLLGRLVGGEAAAIPSEDFRRGLEVELEHGRRFPDANVTNNHPVLTARIVLAHLKEMLDYYLRLAVAELEGDLARAAHEGDGEAAVRTCRRLATARAELADRNRAG